MSGCHDGGHPASTLIDRSHSYLLFYLTGYVSSYYLNLTIENLDQTQELGHYHLSFHSFQMRI